MCKAIKNKKGGHSDCNTRPNRQPEVLMPYSVTINAKSLRY